MAKEAAPTGATTGTGTKKAGGPAFTELVKKLEIGSKKLIAVFQIEHKKMETDAIKDVDKKSFLENPGKNRYEEVVCLESNRVVLTDGLPGNYIHASYVDGYDKPKAYIATQAPKLESVVDFWRMVWQENSKLIVSLTNLKDLDAGNSTCYWPQRPSEIHRYGPIMVRNLGFREAEAWVETVLELAYYGGHTSRIITHFMYGDWDDKRAPASCTSFIKLQKKMMNILEKPLEIGKPHVAKKKNADIKKPKSQPEGPIIVQCSTGAGRAGTFIILDICMKEIQRTKTEQNVRLQRPGAVETENQYICLYLSVILATMERYRSGMSLKLRDIFSQVGGHDNQPVALEQFRPFNPAATILTTTGATPQLGNQPGPAPPQPATLPASHTKETAPTISSPTRQQHQTTTTGTPVPTTGTTPTSETKPDNL